MRFSEWLIHILGSIIQYFPDVIQTRVREGLPTEVPSLEIIIKPGRKIILSVEEGD